MATKIVALHGFLGTPRDFLPLGLDNLIAPHIFLTASCPLESYAQRFNPMLPKKSILLGYSMGARLALHCLLENPAQFNAAIIIAAHPGIKDRTLRDERLARDYHWANKFLKDPWDALMTEWNNGDVLRSSMPVARFERDYSRTALAHCLRYFSLGHQEYLPRKINDVDIPLLWLSAKTENRCADLSLKHPQSNIIEFSDVGHRFMFSMPRTIASIINVFLNRVCARF